MLRELRTLIAVARHGTFASAGARIGLTQSAVSAQIHRLEEELGFPLFDRTGRSARLNAAGRDTLALAEELVTLYERIGHQGADAQGGMVRIGAIASAQVTFLPDAIARFRADLPGCRVRMVPGVSLSLLGQVDAGDIDIAVLIRPPYALPAELDWRPLLREPFELLVPVATGARRSSPHRSSATTAARSGAGWSTSSCASNGWWCRKRSSSMSWRASCSSWRAGWASGCRRARWLPGNGHRAWWRCRWARIRSIAKSGWWSARPIAASLLPAGWRSALPKPRGRWRDSRYSPSAGPLLRLSWNATDTRSAG